MPINELVVSAVKAVYAPELHASVLAGLASIPEEFSDSLRLRPSAEFLQQAVLVLSWGNIDLFHSQLMNACAEPRDVIYVIQSPGEISPTLTCDELIRRYQQLGFPVPHLLGGDG